MSRLTNEGDDPQLAADALSLFALILAFFFYALAFFLYACGDTPSSPPPSPPPSNCECVRIPYREAANLRSTFPETAAEWLKQCGDGATSLIVRHRSRHS